MHNLLFMKREITSLTKESPCKYKEKITTQSRIAKGVCDAMKNASKRAITSSCGTKLEKLLAVANLPNNVDFLDEGSACVSIYNDWLFYFIITI